MEFTKYFHILECQHFEIIFTNPFTQSYENWKVQKHIPKNKIRVLIFLQLKREATFGLGFFSFVKRNLLSFLILVLTTWLHNRTRWTGHKAQIKPKFNFVLSSDPLKVAILQWLFYIFLYKNTFSAKKNTKNNTVFLRTKDFKGI